VLKVFVNSHSPGDWGENRRKRNVTNKTLAAATTIFQKKKKKKKQTTGQHAVRAVSDMFEKAKERRNNNQHLSLNVWKTKAFQKGGGDKCGKEENFEEKQGGVIWRQKR